MCNSLTKKTKRKYFANIAKAESNQTSKLFWNSVKSFITNQGTVSMESTVIKADADKIMKIKRKHDEVSMKTTDLTDDFINDLIIF